MDGDYGVEYVPNLQFSYAEVAVGKTGFIPQGDVSELNDLLWNDTDKPMLVRTLTMDPEDVVSDKVIVSIGVRTRHGLEWITRPSVEASALTLNNDVGLQMADVLGSVAYSVFKLWKPYILRETQSLIVEAGVVANERTVWADREADQQVGVTFHAIGARTRRRYVLGTWDASTTTLRFNVENNKHEDLIITHVCGQRPRTNELAVRIWGPNKERWSDFHRNMNKYSQPLKWSRISFGYLPGGALVLEPEDSIQFRIHNQTESGPTWLHVAMESYVERGA